MKICVSRDISCPQRLAFDYFSDRDNDLEWFRGVLETHRTSEVQRGVGEVNRQKMRLPRMPFTFDIELEVVEWYPPDRYREINKTGFTHYDLWYTVDKIDDTHSRVGLHGDCILKGWLRVFHPLGSRVLNRLTTENFDRLKARLDKIGNIARDGTMLPRGDEQ